MKKLQVLGPGCPKCVELARPTEAAAKARGGDCEVEKSHGYSGHGGDRNHRMCLPRLSMRMSPSGLTQGNAHE